MKERHGPHRVLIPNDGPATRTVNGSKPQGQRPGWCFLCKGEHLFVEPCDQLAGLDWYPPPDMEVVR